MKRLKKKVDPRQKILNHDLSELSDHSSAHKFCQTVILKLGENSSPTYTDLANAVQDATESLPKRSKSQPGWFKMNETKLLPLIELRNQAMKDVFKHRTRSTTKRLQNARKQLKAIDKNFKKPMD